MIFYNWYWGDEDGTIWLKFNSDTVSSTNYDVTKTEMNAAVGTTPERVRKIAYLGNIQGAGSIQLVAVHGEKAIDGVVGDYRVNDDSTIQNAVNGTQIISTNVGVYDIDAIFDYFAEGTHAYKNVTYIEVLIGTKKLD